MSRYIGHILLLVPVAHREQAALAAASITQNDADATSDFFSRAVRPAGQAGEQASHYLACTLATASTVEQLPALEQIFDGSAWVLWWPAGESAPSMTVGDWLDGLGLELVPDPDPDPEL